MGFLDKLKAKVSSAGTSSSSGSSPAKKSENGDTADLGTGPRRYVPRTYATANTANTDPNWTPPTKVEDKKDTLVGNEGVKAT